MRVIYLDADFASATGETGPRSYAFARRLAARGPDGRPPLGFVNPWLYALGARGQGFYDIAGSNNQTNPQTPCCVATRGFDQASGLGAPRFVDIAARVPSAAQGRS